MLFSTDNESGRLCLAQEYVITQPQARATGEVVVTPSPPCQNNSRLWGSQSIWLIALVWQSVSSGCW